MMTNNDLRAPARAGVPRGASSTGDAGTPGASLVARDITVRWHGAVAVDSCSLSVAPGEALCVLGRNGAGKTSWLSAIAGVAPCTGEVVLDGRTVPHRAPHWLAQHRLIMVPEGRQLIAELSVEDNLLLGAYPWTRRIDTARGSAELADVYRLFPRLSERTRQRAGTLSGGEQQMVAIGRAIMGRPQVLILDEPSLGLSPSMTDTTYAVLTSLHERGIALVLVEESPRRALELCDRGVVLASGRIIAEDDVSALRAPGVLEKLYLR